MTLILPEPDRASAFSNDAPLTPLRSFPSLSDGKIDVMAYYYPQWHSDPRNAELVRPGWTEWELLDSTTPRFEGHRQPRRPLRRYDESDPAEATRAASTAVEAGLRGFIVDWYWYDDAPFLNGFLDRGLLQGTLDDDFRFAIMWANHEWADLFPASGPELAALLPGPNARPAFRHAARHLMDRYFTHPAYWKIDGRPYFSIYDLPALVRGLGGLQATRDALQGLRKLAMDTGLPGLHLNGVLTPAVRNPAEVTAALELDSVTHYTWWHHLGSRATFPTTAWSTLRDAGEQAAAAATAAGLPLLPHVTVGWDPSPRTEPWSNAADLGYPFTTLVNDAEPDTFATALTHAVSLARSIDSPAVTINAWNEWTEGSYLEPDEIHGDGYLNAIRAALQQTAARVPL